jgi:hypothetical protein
VEKKTIGHKIGEYLLYLTTADLGTLLLKLLFHVVIAPAVDEVVNRSGTQAMVLRDTIYHSLCLFCYIALFFILLWKNPVSRNPYLTRTYGKPYSYLSDLWEVCKTDFPAAFVAGAIFNFPLHFTVLLWGDIHYIPTIFPPIYASWKLFGNVFLSYFVLTFSVSLLLLLFLPLIHILWNKGRLRP